MGRQTLLSELHGEGDSDSIEHVHPRRSGLCFLAFPRLSICEEGRRACLRWAARRYAYPNARCHITPSRFPLEPILRKHLRCELRISCRFLRFFSHSQASEDATRDEGNRHFGRQGEIPPTTFGNLTEVSFSSIKGTPQSFMMSSDEQITPSSLASFLFHQSNNDRGVLNRADSPVSEVDGRRNAPN